MVRLAVLRRIPPFAVGSQVVLTDGRTAVVTAPNLTQPCRPSVRLLDEKAGLLGGERETVNLVDHPAVHVASCAGVDVRKWVFQLADPKGRPQAA